jgi:hypothetical protein
MIHRLNRDPHSAYYKVQWVSLGRLRIRLQESNIRMDLREINVASDAETQQTGSGKGLLRDFGVSNVGS